MLTLQIGNLDNILIMSCPGGDLCFLSVLIVLCRATDINACVLTEHQT